MRIKTVSKIKSKYHYKNVEYITDIKGRKTKVIMSLDSYNEIMEDLHDLSIVAERKNDSTISINKVYSDLKKNGLI